MLTSHTEIFQFRWALEPAIAVSAVGNATTAGLRAVRENLDIQEEALARGDTEMWAKADLNYHLLLSRLTGNSLFIRVMENRCTLGSSVKNYNALALTYSPHLCFISVFGRQVGGWKEGA